MDKKINLKNWLVMAVILLVGAVPAWATGTYDDGDGTPGNPFQINTPAQMDEIGQYPEDWASCFILTADIDLAAYTGTQFNIIGNDVNDFTGVFDGNDHTINNFTYTTTATNYIGLFGYVGSGGEIKDLGMVNVNVDAGSGNFVGGLVGYNDGTVSNCYATGAVSGGIFVGGLVGRNYGTVSNCHATGSVTGDYTVGGLVGYNLLDGTVSNCYATGDVTGTGNVGGLVGYNYGTVSNSYAAGAVSGTSNVGGLVGSDSSGSYTSCFWNSDIGPAQGIGNTTDPNVMSRTTAQMQTQSTFTDYGWDFVSESTNGTDNYWRLCVDGIKYPKLACQSITGDLACPAGVDLVDFSFFAGRWLEIGCDTSNDCGRADMDSSTDVGGGDLLILTDNWLADWGWGSIDRADYADRLRALWLGECIANWTGIQTEGHCPNPPFYDDSDWGPGGFGFILNQDPWLADDDTDIEYVYSHLLNQHQTHMLGAQQIRDGWMSHINRMIWVSDEYARGLMDDGYAPPQTGMLALNHLALMIDAQLTTEIFGVFAPGMSDLALQMDDLPIRTTATGYAAHAAQHFALLYCLASNVDRNLSMKDQVLWLADEARKYIPDTSKSADIYDFVKADYLANGDKDNWESTRDKIYDRYQLNAASNGFRYQTWYESSINFATGIMALLYGEGDYKKTVKIGTLSGWDSDNSTATLGGLLGFMYGYDALVALFPGQGTFSDRYWINRTRDNMPDYLPGDPDAEDTFTMLANRMLDTIDIAVQAGGGYVDSGNNQWVLPPAITADHLQYNPLYAEMQRSANNRVREAGGTVTPACSVSATYLDKLADGFEHNFAGEEWWPTGDPWYCSTAAGPGHTGESQTLSVTYDRLVDVAVIRYIEGAGDSAGGWFTSAGVEVKISSVWQSPPGTVIAAEPLNENQDYQIIDYVLTEPVQATGVRITGTVGGTEGYVTALELDAMSTPPTDTAPSYVSITSPSNEDSFDEGETITIEVYAVDIDGTVQKVEFLDGFSKIGEDLTEPYSFGWMGASVGQHSLRAKATDNDDKITTSAAVNITVNPIGMPDVVITSPSNGNSFDIGEMITITADACDVDGSIIKVEFFDGVSKLGEDTTEPYSFGWASATAGQHSLKAKATDNDDKTITSAAVNIAVCNPPAVSGIWRSFDVIMIPSGSPQAMVTDGADVTAEIEFYESANDNGVNMGTLFDVYDEGEHWEDFNHAEYIWAFDTGEEAYPYAAKSTVGRGSDGGEDDGTPVPTPSGVFDLQSHPPWETGGNDHLTVAAFIVPEAGSYSVYDLAVRRVHYEGSLAGYRVFNSNKNLLTHIFASTDRDWVTDPNTYNLGSRQVDDRIYFATDREDANCWWDATEIIWTVEKTGP